MQTRFLAPLARATSAGLLLGLLAACASQRSGLAPAVSVGVDPRREPVHPRDDREPWGFRLAVSGFARDVELAEVDADGEGATPDLTTPVERDRRGVRFRWGSQHLGGYFEVFDEDMDLFIGPGMPLSLDTYGVFTSLVGAARVNDKSSEFGFLIPYQVGVRSGIGDDVSYAEVEAGVGLGFEWQGLIAKGGYQFDGFLATFDLPAAALVDEDFIGFNSGPFFEAMYKHADFPVFARVVLGGGDFDTSEVEVGVAF